MGTGRGGDRVTRLLLLAAVLLVTSGLVAGGVTAWGWWGRVRAVHAAQERLAGQWAAGERRTGGEPTAAAEAAGRRPPAPMPFSAPDGDEPAATGEGAGGTGAEPLDGAPIARLYVPTLRLTLLVVEGADDAHLMLGPGRIAGTAPLGASGNTGIAGHRYPGVFWDLDDLEVSAPVVVETRDTWLVYRVVDASVVRPEQNEVLAPPAPGAGPLLTLVTCEPKLSTSHRLIRQATLIRRDPHDGPRPVELG